MDDLHLLLDYSSGLGSFRAKKDVKVSLRVNCMIEDDDGAMKPQ